MVSNLAYARAIGERGAELAKDKTNLGCDLAIRQTNCAGASLRESRFYKVLDDQPTSLFLDLGMSSNFPLFLFECGEDDRHNEKDVVRAVLLGCLLQHSPL